MRGYGFPTRFYTNQGFRVTSQFGQRPDPFNPGKKVFHTGIDYGFKPQGFPVLTTIKGVVFATGSYGGWGNLVGVKDSQKYNHLFAHLRDIFVANGQVVAQGDQVGTVGRTGNATGPHLHYQINRPGTGVNGGGYFGNPDHYYFEEEGEVKIVERAIVIGGDADYFNAAPLRNRLNCPIFAFAALGELSKVSTVYVCGGDVEIVREAAPASEIVNLSGSNRFETAAKIAAYLQG